MRKKLDAILENLGYRSLVLSVANRKPSSSQQPPRTLPREIIRFFFLPSPFGIYSLAPKFRGELDETFQETSLLSEAYATDSLTQKGKYGGIYDAALARSYQNDNRREPTSTATDILHP